MNRIKEQRVSLRVGIKRLASIIKKGGGYELIQGDKETKNITIQIVDISSGGLCIESKKSFQAGLLFELEIPKIVHLDTKILACEVTRSIFREDPRYYIQTGTAQDKSYYEIGLKFKSPNTEYLKEFLELALAEKI